MNSGEQGNINKSSFAVSSRTSLMETTPGELKDADGITYEKNDSTAKDSQYSIMSSSKFFFKHSFRDINRRKFHFCLSFCSVFIVVWSALVINTLVEKGPVIFLKMAEGIQGQYDGIIYPTKQFMGLEDYENVEGIFVNYTRVQKITDKKYNLAPRKQFCDSHVGAEKNEPLRNSMCLMLMDTELERSINLGSRYPFKPMKEGECFINEDQAMLMKVGLGD